MDLYSKLLDVEKLNKVFKEIVESRPEYGFLDRIPSFILSRWGVQKSHNERIRKLFKDELTVSFPITFNKPVKDVLTYSERKKYCDEIDIIVNKLRAVITVKETGTVVDSEYVDFYRSENREEIHVENIKSQLVRLIDRALWENTNSININKDMSFNVIGYCRAKDCNPCIILTNGENTLKLKDNINVTKTIRRLIRFYNLDKNFEKTFENFLINASIIKQRTRDEGTLCLSIDPIDFLTASINSYGWDSCFNLYTGENANHCFGAMTADNTIIAYIKGNEELVIGGESVPNKRWRSFVYLDEVTLYPAKGYPYQSSGISDSIAEYILKEAYNDKNMICSKQVEDSSICGDSGYGIYDDSDSEDNFYFIPRNEKESKDKVERYYSVAEMPCCLECGDEIYDGERLLCSHCLNIEYCEECGEMIINRDEDKVLRNHYGTPYCSEYCYSLNNYEEDEEEEEEDIELE